MFTSALNGCHCTRQSRQGTDLIDLRLTWRFWFLGDFWGFLETFLRIFGRNFEEFWRIWLVVRRKLRTSMNQRPTRKMRFWGHWPPNSLRGQIWPQIWHLWPKLNMLPCLFGLFWPFFELWRKKKKEERKKERKKNLAQLDLSASPQVKILCSDVHRVWRRG